MKELAEFIVGNIIDKKEFTVSELEDDGRLVIEIKVSPEVIGIVIGKGGNTIKAIQTLLRVKGRLQDKLVSVTITEA